MVANRNLTLSTSPEPRPSRADEPLLPGLERFALYIEHAILTDTMRPTTVEENFIFTKNEEGRLVITPRKEK